MSKEWWEIDETDVNAKIQRLQKAYQILKARCDGNEDAEHALDIFLSFITLENGIRIELPCGLMIMGGTRFYFSNPNALSCAITKALDQLNFAGPETSDRLAAQIVSTMLSFQDRES